MIFPDNFENKIGFDSIRVILKKGCLCALGEEHVDGIRFSNDINTIQKQLDLTEEFRQIILFEETFPSYNYIDLTPEMKRLSTEGTFIDTEKLFDLKCSYSTIGDCTKYIKKLDTEKYPNIIEIGDGVNFLVDIINLIDSIIDERGIIRDNASENLKVIRREYISKQISIDRKIKTILQNLKKDSVIPDDTEITIRSGRMVLPIPASNKRKLKGFVHDESATGQTVYIEPSEILELNNDLRDLENEEKREIVKILSAFTSKLRPLIPEILNSYKTLGLFDFLRAKANLAIEQGAFRPSMKDKPMFNWYAAYNPILYLLFKKTGKNVVPFDINLGEDKKILVISGPNAGGKSVCLKSVGLIQYMLQCGLLATLKEYSEAGVFKDLFIEIGDEQSIENDLSTYSSHLLNMKYLVEKADTNSLFLIDEMGSGTEPQLGGAIAESIIEKLIMNNATGIITTHYTNIKLMAAKNPTIGNAAMLYDLKNLKPLFKLKQGNPGSSFAFEIARNIGFPSDILEDASERVGKDYMDFDRQIQQLEADKLEIKKKQDEIKVADDFLSEMIDKYQKKIFELETRKNEIIKNARSEAEKLLSEANRLIESTIKEIKESSADKEITRNARFKITRFEKEKINAPTANSKITIRNRDVEVTKKYYTVDEDLLPVPGDKVKLKDQEIFGEITEVNNKIATVATEYITLKIPVTNLVKISNLPHKGKTANKYGKIINEINEKAVNFNTRIDVRGCRAEEILPIVQKFIDDALLLGFYELSILHGKGNGVLRKMIREYLHVLHDVDSFKDEILESGGDGITIVKLRNKI